MLLKTNQNQHDKPNQKLLRLQEQIKDIHVSQQAKLRDNRLRKRTSFIL